MSRWLPTTVLLGAIAFVSASGCGPASPTGTGKGGAPTSGAAATGKAAETGKSTAKGDDDHHHPG
jgi:hypothetical protein